MGNVWRRRADLPNENGVKVTRYAFDSYRIHWPGLWLPEGLVSFGAGQ